MTRITGQQARELLDGTTPGPWQEEDREHGGCVVLSDGHGPVAFVSNREGADPGEVPSEIDGRLLAAAPALAETVAWLYGAAGHDAEYRFRRWPLGGSWSVAHRDGYISIGPEGSGIGFRTPDEAVEAARALLAASEEARRD